ncbi:MAG TPA: hypothetical protein VES42_24770 [Pilimelia sp.]|nr:hypothetical protein [Pilimelia sp.]
MRPDMFRLPAVSSAGLLASLVIAVGPAHADLACAPDPYEKVEAAPLTAGATTTRAICQEPTPQPRTESPQDEDRFAFTASGDAAYTVQAVDVGAALTNDAFDRGGLELGVSRLNADGTTTAIEQNRHLNGDRVITPVLAAGRYVVLASTDDHQVYPETNTMDVKTVQGAEGSYGVRLTESAPAPVVTSFTVSSGTVRGGSSVTGTYTLSAPAPPGGMPVDVTSSHGYTAYPRSAFAPAGATRVSFGITARSGATDLRVTLTAWARVGAAQSLVLTVRR